MSQTSEPTKGAKKEPAKASARKPDSGSPAPSSKPPAEKPPAASSKPPAEKVASGKARAGKPVVQKPIEPSNPPREKPARSEERARPSVSENAPLVTQSQKGDLLTEIWLRFARFGWDILGVGLIASALVTLIGFISRGLQLEGAQGFFVSWWVSVLAQGFGWGWPLVIAALSILGLMCLRRRFSAWPRIHLGRVLALEGLAFGLLTLLAILGGFSLENAEAGQDGGVIGWGLARLLDRALPLPWSTMVVLALMALFAIYGLGGWQWIVMRLKRWSRAVSAPPSSLAAAPSSVPPVGEAAVDHPPAPISASPLAPVQTRRLNLPPLGILLDDQEHRPDEEKIAETAGLITHTLAEFGVPARVLGHRIGPTVTQFAVEPGFVEKPGPDGDVTRQKVRVAQISSLSRDLALALSAERLRIEAPVPGQSFVGIEVPNQRVSIVRLRSLLASESFRKLSSPLAVAFGRDVSGEPVVADLARMPHLLIAGTTGSGKSVCIAALVACLVMNNTPDELRMALLDPKMVELARFNGLPHIFGKVETAIDRMLGVLQWALMEMDRRYRLLEEAHARDIFSYNAKQAKKNLPGLPRIVVLIDELADLMMTAPDQTEHSLIRLAQMARATGMHLVVATQRPSTDVITGLIKANFPARLAFTVASSIDSRVILDVTGAETLLGKGDMLFLNPESGTPVRAQGVLIADGEVDQVLEFWQKKKDPAVPAEIAPWEQLVQAGKEEDNSDKLVQQATQVVRQTQRASASLLQRRLRIGYPRAARLMDELEVLGVVGPSQGGGKERDVLLPPRDGDEDEEDG